MGDLMSPRQEDVPLVSVEKLMQSHPTKSGFLTKQGGAVKSWRKRFFVLVKDQLYYFDNEKAKEPKGHMYINNQCSVSNTYHKGQTNCFAIKTPQRAYTLSASSVQECEEWIRTLNEIAHGKAGKHGPAPMKPQITKKKQQQQLESGKINEHVLLTRNVIERMKGEQNDDVKELCKVAESYLAAAASLAQLGKQMSDSIIKVSAGTQNTDVGEALKECAQALKASYIQMQEENKVLKYQVVAALHNSGEKDLQRVKSFEKTLNKELKTANDKIKKATSAAKKAKSRDQRDDIIRQACDDRDHVREKLLREALQLERAKYRAILEHWMTLQKCKEKHYQDNVNLLKEELPRWDRFSTSPEFQKTFPESVENLIAGRYERVKSHVSLEERAHVDDREHDQYQDVGGIHQYGGSPGGPPGGGGGGFGTFQSDQFSMGGPNEQYAPAPNRLEGGGGDDQYRQFGTGGISLPPPIAQGGGGGGGGPPPPMMGGGGGPPPVPAGGPPPVPAGGPPGGDMGMSMGAPPGAPPPAPPPPGSGPPMPMGGGGGGGAPGEFKVRAIWESTADEEGELGFAEGEELTIFDASDDDWWSARNAQGQEGTVPSSYVERI